MFTDLSHRNKFHPIREYLDGLTWDGVPRLGTWLIKYGGAKDTAYVRAVGRLPLIAAVRRVRKPGVKFDEMVILEGMQGTEKSTAIEVLAGDEFFTNEFQLGMNSQKTLEAISGKWLIEIPELSGMRRGEVETIKATISRRTDPARKAYDRLVSQVPRQCVFFGSTNADRYLLDTTGNRRFWPVAIERFRIDWPPALMLSACDVTKDGRAKPGAPMPERRLFCGPPTTARRYRHHGLARPRRRAHET